LQVPLKWGNWLKLRGSTNDLSGWKAVKGIGSALLIFDPRKTLLPSANHMAFRCAKTGPFAVTIDPFIHKWPSTRGPIGTDERR
jgi:hypothetical protein